jgi:CRISPR type III-B/RAMP module RAMP protein Cmr6
MAYNYPLPKNTLHVFRNLKYQSQNMGLLFHKFGHFENGWRLEGKDKKARLRNFIGAFNGHSETEKIICKLKSRQDSMLEAYNNSLGYEVKPFIMETIWRMVVGLGSANVLEGSGMTLHHIYGFPYIPASGVKGILSHYVVEDQRLKENDDKFIKDRFIKIFGDQERKGMIVFFDAFPIGMPKLELDIINAHYGKYYTGNEPPADYLSPNPVYFLTVGKGSKFRFSVASKDGVLLDKVEKWLKEAISQFGVGAKTRAGYGEMEVKVAKSNEKSADT